ncbi:MAG: PAS domain-containing protein [Firmicutes bacterium]|nr:PAS domain-containing protein [Bacillota bacterium]
MRISLNANRLKRLFATPVYVTLITAISILLIETINLIVLNGFRIQRQKDLFDVVLDAVFMMLMLIPVLLFFVYRPMKSYLTAKERVEEKLLANNQELESKVLERTAELEKLHRLMEKKYQEELEFTQVKLISVINSLRIGVSTLNKDMQVLTTNEQMVRWFPALDPAKKSICHEVFFSDLRDGICPDCPVQRAFSDGETHETIKQQRYHGQVKHWRLMSSPNKNNRGEVVAVTLFTEDVTERVKAEHSLRELNDNLANIVKRRTQQINGILESISDPLFLLDTNGEFVFLNSGAERLLKKNQQELLGKSIWDEFPETLDPKLHSVFCQALVENVSLEYEADHSNRWLHVKVYPCGPGIVIYLMDLTQRKQMELDLQQSYANLTNTFTEIVNSLATITEKRDPYSAGHMKRVAELCSAIAGELGVSEKVAKSVFIAGALHDIGKIYVPTDILNKPGRLTDLEMGIIKTHPQIAYEVLEKIPFEHPVAETVLQHHERLNGSGYPNGLIGDNLLLEARILAVADVVEAMASHRPYRPAIGLDKALAEIESNKGVLYDPEVVDACLRLFGGEYRLEFTA